MNCGTLVVFIKLCCHHSFDFQWLKGAVIFPGMLSSDGTSKPPLKWRRVLLKDLKSVEQLLLETRSIISRQRFQLFLFSVSLFTCLILFLAALIRELWRFQERFQQWIGLALRLFSRRFWSYCGWVNVSCKHGWVISSYILCVELFPRHVDWEIMIRRKCLVN